jgi:hypothetical protein
MNNLTSSVMPACNQSWLLGLSGAALLVKLLMGANYMSLLYFLIFIVLSIMVLNCLCMSGCSVLGWIYAIFYSVVFIAALNVIPAGFDGRVSQLLSVLNDQYCALVKQGTHA